MKIFILTGEPSGDLYGAYLVRELLQLDPDLEIRAWGGDRMIATGICISRHIRELAYMGIWEVMVHLPGIIANFKSCKKEIKKFDPDLIVYVDYPGFNMRIASWAHKNGYKNIYYIPPQVWAWGKGRTKKIRRNFARVIAVLPIEKHHFDQYGVSCPYVGHPILDSIKDFTPDPGFREAFALTKDPVVALFPGSRLQEINNCLPIMLSASEQYNEFQICIARHGNIDIAVYEKILKQWGSPREIKLISDRSYDLLNIAENALITSGTASLEAALFNVPHVVCYKTSLLTYVAGRLLIRVKYLSLVNILGKKQIVRELIQSKLNTFNLINSINELQEDEVTNEMKIEFQNLRSILGPAGASQRAAKIILQH